MSNYRIASRYAKSFISLSVEYNKLEEVRKDFESFLNICKTNRKLVLFLKNPVIHNYRKLTIIRKIFESGFDKVTMRFLEIITRKGREDVLPEIATVFIEKYREHKGIVVAKIETPVKVEESLRQKFEKVVKEIAGQDKTVQFIEKVDRDLIGGYILTVGDKQIDDSISKKLRELKQNLTI